MSARASGKIPARDFHRCLPSSVAHLSARLLPYHKYIKCHRIKRFFPAMAVDNLEKPVADLIGQ
jgi:hypothetical protein